MDRKNILPAQAEKDGNYSIMVMPAHVPWKLLAGWGEPFYSNSPFFAYKIKILMESDAG